MVKEVWVLTKREVADGKDDYEDNVIGVYVEIPTVEHLIETYNIPELQAVSLTILKSSGLYWFEKTNFYE